MSRERLLYTRAAKVRIQALPAVVQMDLETHLENLALLMETSPQLLPSVLERHEDHFVTAIQEIRVRFTVNASTGSMLVHAVDAKPG